MTKLTREQADRQLAAMNSGGKPGNVARTVRHMKTKKEITMKFGEGRPAMGGSIHDITIPAGTRVSETGDGQFFVEDISFLDRNSMAYHDANYYGIRLDADQVEVVEQ